MPTLVRAVALFTVAALSIPSMALAATSKYPEQQRKWIASDKCGQLAFQKYPNHTKEENAKRDAFTRRCLNTWGAPGHSGK
jgi:hypothetical protein